MQNCNPIFMKKIHRKKGLAFYPTLFSQADKATQDCMDVMDWIGWDIKI